MKKKYGIVVISVIIGILLIVQGYQALVIECLRHEIRVLRYQGNASRHDIYDIRMKLADLVNVVNQFPYENKVEWTMDLPDPVPVDIRKAKQSLWQTIKDKLMGLVCDEPELP